MSSGDNGPTRSRKRWGLWKRVGVGIIVFAVAWITYGIWIGSQVRTSFDPIERMRALAPHAPESDRAWPEVRAALGPLKGTVDGSSDPERRANALASAWDAEPSPDQELLYAFLESHADDMATFRAAVSKPVLGHPLSCDATKEDVAFYEWTDDPPADAQSRKTGFALFDVRLPQMAELRLTSGLLAADAIRAAKRGDGATAVADVEASLRIGTFCEEQPFLISVLVNAAIRARVQLVVATLMERHAQAFSDTDLERLASILAQSPPPDVSRAISGERIGFEDVVQTLYTDDGRGDGVMVSSPRLGWLVQSTGGSWEAPPDDSAVSTVVCVLLNPAVAMLAPSRAETMGKYDLMLAEALANSNRPIAEWTDVGDGLAAEGMSDAWRSLDLFALLAPAIGSVGRATQPQADLRQARFAVAMEQTRRRLGEEAPGLDALPNDLRAIASDSLTGLPVTRTVDAESGAVRYGVRLSGGGAFGEGSPQTERARPQSGRWDDSRAQPLDWLWLELRPAKRE